MTNLQLRAVLALGLVAVGMEAQGLDNTALSGKFYFAQLLVTASGGQATDAQNLSGAITFDGTGGFTFTGKSGAGSGAPAAAKGTGTYTVGPSGTVTLSNPIQTSLGMAASLSGDRNVLIGASTEASDNTNDLFVAIRAPAASVTNAVLNGPYTGASLQLPNGQSTSMRTALISFSSSGSGAFSQITATGHAVDQGSSNSTEPASSATYSINADGAGTADFGSAANLFSGTRDIFVSQDGNYVIGVSSVAGGRELFIATKRFSTTAAVSSLSGRYWVAELTISGQGTACSSFDFESASGALISTGAGTANFAERIHVNTSAIDFTGLSYYSVKKDSTGALAPSKQEITNMALGAPVIAGDATVSNALVGAQIGALNTTSCIYGMFFAVRAPEFSSADTLPFVNPAGVVNAASFAPFPNPTAPGAVMSIFGTHLSSLTEMAATLPLPVDLRGVSVAVNGSPAPLYYVSPTQINFQVPFEAAGSTVSVQVIDNGVRSNTVTVPLAATSPGVLQFTDAGDPYRGVAQHLDGTLVSSTADPAKGLGGPARRGEIIVFYATGLGGLLPAVASGYPNPAAPPAVIADGNVTIVIGDELATDVFFAGGTPNYAGLYQINVRIPQSVIPGANVPVQVITSNADSDLVDIPIAE